MISKVTCTTSYAFCKQIAFLCTGFRSSLVFEKVESIQPTLFRLPTDVHKPLISGISLWGSETQTRPKAVILADTKNGNIKALTLGPVNELSELYHCQPDARVHTVFFTRGWLSPPERAQGSRFCIIQSTGVSRQVGVLIVHETRFDLLQLIEKENNQWEIEIQIEFYRTERNELQAEVPNISLFRWGKQVLCAVAGSFRTSVFQEISLEPAGIHRFDTALLDLKPFESRGGTRLAIAFRDDSIRLYSYKESAGKKKELFELEELFKVHCENVHIILALVPRLIVAEWIENEDNDRLWSCRLDAERLDLEGWVTIEERNSLQSWIGCAEAQAIYIVDKKSEELRVLE